jgi:hypothetical protein
MGRGESPEDARRDALAQLTVVYGSPVEPPPEPIIVQKPSEPPGRNETVGPSPGGRGRNDTDALGELSHAAKSGWIARVSRVVARLLRT